MKLQVHRGLGDQIMHTGLPEALYYYRKEYTEIIGGRLELWSNNPYVRENAGGEEVSLGFNQPRDYMIYYPVRLFYDMTGIIAPAGMVKPRLYKQGVRNARIALVNDQSGWPTRTGYPHFEKLIQLVKKEGYTIHYLRNEGFRDCNGACPPREVQTYDEIHTDISLQELIDRMTSAAVYIGYDSGLAQLAGATDTPYVLLEGPVAPINTVHPSCIWHLDLKACRKCAADNCSNMCLRQAKDINSTIIWAMRHSIGMEYDLHWYTDSK